MYPSGSQPGAAYGLAKVHKKDTPLRPVISMIGTPQYGLAKYLDSIIKPCIPSQFMTSSTQDFINKFEAFHFPHSYALVSFDVESLFTNVPLREAIDLACNYVYASNQPPAYDKVHFRKLLNFATSGEFLYRSSLFKQIDGVAMGSPLGPTLANLFMAHIERNVLCVDNSPLLYVRYVDDIFCVFDTTRQDPAAFLNHINSLHPNLKFTCEIGQTTLPFLDTEVRVEDSKALFSVFRKKTYTGLLMNFGSVCPMSWKRD